MVARCLFSMALDWNMAVDSLTVLEEVEEAAQGAVLSDSKIWSWFELHQEEVVVLGEVPGLAEDEAGDFVAVEK